MLITTINSPDDLKSLSCEELLQLSEEIRSNIIESVAQNGGHLGASLGVIELSVALHYVFNTPDDKIIWDVGHQSYAHKLLTGRKTLDTLKQDNGISGFTKRSESKFDHFGAGHSSTSISAALGIEVANHLNSTNHFTIAVIGDGALTAGIAYEALNNAGSFPNRLIIILNDNEMSISPTEGALSNHLRKISTKESTIAKTLSAIENALTSLPLVHKIPQILEKIRHLALDTLEIKNIFENLGIKYKGLIDGHDLNALINLLQQTKISQREEQCPILIHVKTEKGKGFFSPNGNITEKFHAVNKFCTETFLQEKQGGLTYTNAFSAKLVQEAKKDNKIVAITAAMPSGTGLELFKSEFPQRFFDVGIAEQHAVTFAAGLATEGIKPFVAIYSTFLQRAYDQIIHDVAIQNLPVKFAIDRAGLVGADGPTHAGSFDIAYMSIIPNMAVMAPASIEDLYQMIELAVEYNSGPIALRYPRGNAPSIPTNNKVKFGKGVIIEEGTDLAIISLGGKLLDAINASKILKEVYNLSTTIIDARFAKPIDESLITKAIKNHQLTITLEEGSIGGFATQVNHLAVQHDLLRKNSIRNIFLPDEFIDHGSLNTMYKKAQIDKCSIINCATSFLKFQI